jgi:spore coat polysaccharide biosynthesis protein SpsF (cytidylyltransferase family)
VEANVDIFVQVRRGSTRLPDKALVALGDRNCLEHVVLRCQAAGLARNVIVCTTTLSEDGVLADEAGRLGAQAYRGDVDNVIDRFLGCAARFGTDVIVRVAGDSPLVAPETVDGAIDHLLTERLDYVHTKQLPVGCYVEAFTTAALRRAAIAAVDASRSDDLTFFVGREEINRVGEYVPRPELRRSDLVLALNRPEDLAVLKEVFAHAPSAGPWLTLTEAIDWLDRHPELAASNRDYVPKPTECNVELDPSRLVAS